MTRSVLGLVGLLLLLPPARVEAQQAPNPTASAVQGERGPSQSSQATQMYEDIAIMRRVLKGKLARYNSAMLVRAETFSDCTKCHSTAHGKPIAIADFDNDGWLDLVTANQHGVPTLYRNTGDGKFLDTTALSGFMDAHRGLLAKERPSLDIEGAYLRGHGVVFTVTMPTPPSDPHRGATPASNKPLSDWDRARKEIRNEKLTAEESKQQPAEPALADVILKVLADNGKHFGQLKPEETLTVAVTFRHGTAQPIAVFHDATVPGGQAQTTGQAKPASDKDSSGAAKPATTARDYVLLGDLHLKQGKLQDALQSYEAAARIEPKVAKDPAILERLAQVYAAQGAKDQAAAMIAHARKLQEDAAAQQAKNTQGGESSAAPLPAKLIVSISKRVLDQVGSGNLSMEAFRKEAHVENLTFPTQQK